MMLRICVRCGAMWFGDGCVLCNVRGVVYAELEILKFRDRSRRWLARSSS